MPKKIVGILGRPLKSVTLWINSVWHEVSEEPERNRIYLAQLGDCAFDTFYDSENWVNFSRGINIQRWAYVEDLLPNKQEEFI